MDNIDSVLRKNSQELRRLARIYWQKGFTEEAQELDQAVARILKNVGDEGGEAADNDAAGRA